MVVKLSSLFFLLIAGLVIGFLLLQTDAPAIGAQREYPEPPKPEPKPAPSKSKSASKPKTAPPKKSPPKAKSPARSSASKPTLSAEQYVERGDKLAGEARWAEAEVEYLQAVRVEPENVRWRVSLAIALTRQKKYAAAEAQYREAARIEPNNAQWRAGIGDRLTEQQKYAQAEAAYREAVRLEPENVYWRAYLGFVLARQKKYAQAEAEYRRAAELDPNNASRYAAIGDRLVEQLKYAEAEAEYRRSVRIEPNNARWRDYLGYALIKQQKWAEAEAEYREAVRLDPSEPRYKELLKEVSGKATTSPAPMKSANNLSQPDVAPRTSQPVVTPAVRYALDGDRLMKEKKWAEAEAAYRQATKLDANNAVLRTKLAIALSAQQKNAEAEIQHREAVRLEPTKALWRFNLGVVLNRLGKNAEAQVELAEAVRLDPKNVQYRGTWKQVSDLLTASATASPASPTEGVVNPSGVWSIEARTAQGNVIAGFKLQYEGDRLTGTFIGPAGTSPIQKASISGNQLQFTTSIKVGNDMREATVTGIIKNNLISGVLKITAIGSFEFTGSRAK